MSRLTFAVGLTLLMAGTALADEGKYGLKPGTPDVQSAGALAFGPEGILLIGDTNSAAIFAIATGDTQGSPGQATINVEDVEGKIAGMLGTTTRDVSINDMVVNPATGHVFLSVTRGQGPSAMPALFRVNSKGEISEVPLKNVPFAKAGLPNAPAPGGEGRNNKRSQAITDIAYIDGQVFVAGLSNEEFESTLRSIPFPFSDINAGTGVKIYHGAHGRFETSSPVRTFTNYAIGGEQHLLAAYTCTPLVKFRVADLKPGANLEGTTIAELGNRNRPLDMFVYQKDGKDYVLMANSSRGVMKITTDNIGQTEPITDKIDGGGTAGLSYNTIDELKGVEQLDRLNEGHAIILVRSEDGAASLKTIELP